MSVNKISEQARGRMREISPLGLPNNPSAAKKSAEEIKKAMTEFVTGVSESDDALENKTNVVKEVNRIVDETNAEISYVNSDIAELNSELNSVNESLIIVREESGTAVSLASAAYETANAIDSKATTALENASEALSISRESEQRAANSAQRAEAAASAVQNKADVNYVDERISEVIGAAPDALNTLQELSAALDDDENFAATVTNELSHKVDKENGKTLSSNDFTDNDKTALYNAYVKPTDGIPKTDLSSELVELISQGGDSSVTLNTEQTIFAKKTFKINESASESVSIDGQKLQINGNYPFVDTNLSASALYVTGESDHYQRCEYGGHHITFLDWEVNNKLHIVPSPLYNGTGTNKEYTLTLPLATSTLATIDDVRNASDSTVIGLNTERKNNLYFTLSGTKLTISIT